MKYTVKYNAWSIYNPKIQMYSTGNKYTPEFLDADIFDTREDARDSLNQDYDHLKGYKVIKVVVEVIYTPQHNLKRTEYYVHYNGLFEDVTGKYCIEVIFQNNSAWSINFLSADGKRRPSTFYIFPYEVIQNNVKNGVWKKISKEELNKISKEELNLKRSSLL